MRISTKGRYGLRAMIDIAVNSSGSPVPLSAIAQRQQISEYYLEHVFASLRKSGLVRSEKGAQGGYELAEEPEKITVKDVLYALEGDMSIIDSDKKNWNSMDYFLNDKVWKKIDESIENIISSLTLRDLISEYKNLENNISYMYYI